MPKIPVHQKLATFIYGEIDDVIDQQNAGDPVVSELLGILSSETIRYFTPWTLPLDAKFSRVVILEVLEQLGLLATDKIIDGNTLRKQPSTERSLWV